MTEDLVSTGLQHQTAGLPSSRPVETLKTTGSLLAIVFNCGSISQEEAEEKGEEKRVEIEKDDAVIIIQRRDGKPLLQVKCFLQLSSPSRPVPSGESEGPGNKQEKLALMTAPSPIPILTKKKKVG